MLQYVPFEALYIFQNSPDPFRGYNRLVVCKFNVNILKWKKHIPGRSSQFLCHGPRQLVSN